MIKWQAIKRDNVRWVGFVAGVEVFSVSFTRTAGGQWGYGVESTWRVLAVKSNGERFQVHQSKGATGADECKRAAHNWAVNNLLPPIQETIRRTVQKHKGEQS